MPKDKDKYIISLTKELDRVKADRAKYIQWVADLRGSLNRITSIADESKNWK